jgi:hypothetical protein
MAHRLGSVALEQKQNVQVSGADRAQAAVPRYGTSLARNERLELVEDLLDDRVGHPCRRDWFMPG